MMNYPKILIIGQNFNMSTGGGITLTNMFKSWPLDRIASAIPASMAINTNYKICKNVYFLGNKERKFLYPLKLFNKQYPSGKVVHDTKEYSNAITMSHKNNNFRSFLMRLLITLKKTGIYNILEYYKLSKKFINWIEEFKPDVIYTQPLASLAMVKMVNNLIERKKIPLIIHIMDDFQETISGVGVFRLFFKNMVHREMVRLSRNSVLRLAISEQMSEEYKNRYGNDWHYLHNSINIQKWIPYVKKNYEFNKKVRILYTGRIGIANKKLIFKFSRLIKQINIENIDLEFHIYSSTNGKKNLSKINQSEKVFFHNSVKHEKLPFIMSEYDILLLPLDFDLESRRFAQYSIPTKLTEYMISGVPILVFAPEECAVSNYVIKNEIAFVCNSENKNDIISCINNILNNKNERERIAKKAVNLAIKQHDIKKENERFKFLVINSVGNNTKEGKNYV